MRLILATVALGPAMLGLLWLPGHGAELAAWLTLAPALVALGWALIDQDHQTLYDRLAGTRLVMLPVQTR
jgi:uncharacterized RDD family membrane protein YckC